MPNTFYQQYFEAQKAMFDAWHQNMQAAYAKNADGEAGASANPMDFFNKMLEAPNEFWKKASESYKSYHASFELWRQLSESAAPLDKKAVLEIYETWVKRSFDLVKSNFVPNLPGYMRNFTEKLVENMELSGDALNDAMKTWVANEESLQKAFQNTLVHGPKGYIDLLQAWQDSYDASFGKFINAPTFGKDMEFWKHQKASFDRFIKFNTAAAKFYASLFEIAQDATKHVIEDYAAMQAEGTQPKTFDEFYKYWSKAVSTAYEKVLFSENLSVLSGNMVDAMSRFKMEHDKLYSFYLANVPVPKKSDMDDLYKTVYELKKEIRALKKEIRANEHRNA